MAIELFRPADRDRIAPDRQRQRNSNLLKAGYKEMARSKLPDPAARVRREFDAHVDASPAADSEWLRLLAIFDRYELGHLLNLPPSSVARYAAGDRRTPEVAAARLHAVALIVGDLAGDNDEIALRRWFDRPRSALDGRAPAHFLKGDWQPDDPGPRRVRELARSEADSRI